MGLISFKAGSDKLDNKMYMDAMEDAVQKISDTLITAAKNDKRVIAMKKFLITILLALSVVVLCSAAKIEQGATVAVMDFGTYPSAVPIDIDIFNAGKAVCEYHNSLQKAVLNTVENLLLKLYGEPKK